MEIHVRDNSKIVEVWLSREEKQDINVWERLKPMYQEYKAKKYLVAVFESGDQDLAELTGSLLGYNRKRTVQLEMEREKRQHIPQERNPISRRHIQCHPKNNF